MKKEDIFVGMKLYEVDSRYCHDNSKNEISERTITKIGNKLFEVDNSDRCKFNIETLKYVNKEYSQSNRQLYFSEQEILDQRERGTLIQKLRKAFDWGGPQLQCTLEQLREVTKILNIE